jgi:hypothetical protein
MNLVWARWIWRFFFELVAPVVHGHDLDVLRPAMVVPPGSSDLVEG